jgi:hypothetical protein
MMVGPRALDVVYQSVFHDLHAWRCVRCGGTGTVGRQGYSVNPFTGTLVPDPQFDTRESCDECNGTGFVAPTEADER